MYDLCGFPSRAMAPGTNTEGMSFHQKWAILARCEHVVLRGLPLAVGWEQPCTGGTDFIGGSGATLGGVPCVDGVTLGALFCGLPAIKPENVE